MQPTTVSWPKLRAFTAYVSFDVAAVLGPSTALDHCPRLIAPILSSFSTAYLNPTLITCLPPLHLISTVELLNRPESFLRGNQTGASLEDFLQVLYLFPLLQQLTIAVDDIELPLPPASEPATLPFLHCLCLSSSHPPAESTWNVPWITNTLWTYFIAPKLNELSVPQRWFEMGAIVELNEFFRSNSRVPALIEFIECPTDLGERWRLRHQEAWPQSVVTVRRMVWAGPDSGCLLYIQYLSNSNDMIESNDMVIATNSSNSSLPYSDCANRAIDLLDEGPPMNDIQPHSSLLAPTTQGGIGLASLLQDTEMLDINDPNIRPVTKKDLTAGHSLDRQHQTAQTTALMSMRDSAWTPLYTELRNKRRYDYEYESEYEFDCACYFSKRFIFCWVSVVGTSENTS
ncbi:hypothetical protein B0H12DRAFT_1067066 [Mycena haematopus]|nr:hypothetical protein B0H12DRAFT_1067066 [Mycena haematopus]